MSQLPDKPCAVCGTMLHPIDQYDFPEVLCYTCWQDVQEAERELDAVNRCQENAILQVKMENDGLL